MDKRFEQPNMHEINRRADMRIQQPGHISTINVNNDVYDRHCKLYGGVDNSNYKIKKDDDPYIIKSIIDKY